MAKHCGIDDHRKIEVEDETPNSELSCIIIKNCPKPRRTYVKFYDKDDSVEEILPYTSTDGSRLELNMSMTFPTDQKVLNDPGFWVADTGTSVHMMPFKEGMYDLKESTTCITMGNKNKVLSMQSRKLNGMMCIKNGDTVRE